MKVGFRNLDFVILLVLTQVLYLALGRSSVVAAPFWLKSGAYAYYDVETRIFHFKNGTSFYSAKGIYGWRCLSVSGSNSSLEVVFQVNLTEISPPQRVEFKRTFILTVNLETRESYSGGVFVGFVPFWIDITVQKGENITMSRAYNQTLKGKVYGAVSQFRIQTPYRNFTGDEIWNVATESVPLEWGGNYIGHYFFEKDSGLLIAGSFRGDLLEKLEIEKYAYPERTWAFELLDTNIEFREPGTQGTSPFQTLFLYAAAVIATLAITTIIYLKIRKHRSPTHESEIHPASTTSTLGIPLSSPRTMMEKGVAGYS